MVGKYFHLAATQVWTKPLAQRLGSSKAGDVCFVAAGRAGSGHEAGKSDLCISTAQTQLHTEHEAGRAPQSLCSTHLSHCPSRPSVLPNKGLSNLFLILQRPKFVLAQATHSCFTGSLFLLPHTQVLPHCVRARIRRDGGVYTCCTSPPEACLSLHVHDPLCALVTGLVTLCFMQTAPRVGQASVCPSVHSHLTDRRTAHASSLRPCPAWEVLGEGALLAALHQAAR